MKNFLICKNISNVREERKKNILAREKFQIFKMRTRIFRIKRDTHTREKRDGLKTESGNQ